MAESCMSAEPTVRDITPTVLDLPGVGAPLDLDGASLLPGACWPALPDWRALTYGTPAPWSAGNSESGPLGPGFGAPQDIWRMAPRWLAGPTSIGPCG